MLRDGLRHVTNKQTNLKQAACTIRRYPLSTPQCENERFCPRGQHTPARLTPTEKSRFGV